MQAMMQQDVFWWFLLEHGFLLEGGSVNSTFECNLPQDYLGFKPTISYTTTTSGLSALSDPNYATPLA